MQLLKLLHTQFKKQLPSVHQSRINCLFQASEALLSSKKLTLTGLGRDLSNQNKPRSNIKKIDRLLGNTLLHKESLSFYKVMTSRLIKENSTPWLHIDWSCICSLTNLYLLRASLSMSGRSIVIYEESHFKKHENNHCTHKTFLNRLKSILPKYVKPIVVTDAGFRGPWFNEILAMGWDFVGRVRNKNLVCLEGQSTWHLSKFLYFGATAKPRYLGPGFLSQSHKIHAHFILYKDKKKQRHKVNKDKTLCHSGKSIKYAKSYIEPWLLVTSLNTAAEKVVKIYHQRMRIEENIRDTKSNRYGFGLKESRTRSPERMKILLLICAITTLACWLASIISRKNGTASDFQAHSAKFTSALSNVYLGREYLRKGVRISGKEFKSAIKQLIRLTYQVQKEASTCIVI
jgi:hypothetical protein